MASQQRLTAVEIRRQRNARLLYGAWALLSAALTLGVLLVLRPGVKEEVDPRDLPVETVDIDLGPLVKEDKPAVEQKVIVESAAKGSAAPPIPTAAPPPEPARPRVVRRRSPPRRQPPRRAVAKPTPKVEAEPPKAQPKRKTAPSIGTVGNPAIGTLKEEPAIGTVRQ